MKKIPLTQGQFAIVDDWWYDYLMQWKWCARWNPHTNSFYAQRSEYSPQKRIILMHRVVSKTPDEMLCDHIHHNTLDNRESELRNVSATQNAINVRLRKDNKIGIPGIRKFSCGSYNARLNFQGKCVLDKTFRKLEDAVAARKKAAEIYFGEFAYDQDDVS